MLSSASYHYSELGVGLHLEKGVRGRIAHEEKRSSTYDALVAVVTEWLQWSYPYQEFGKPSLKLLVPAVYSYDRKLAVKVFKHFTSGAGEHGFCVGICVGNEYINSGH